MDNCLLCKSKDVSNYFTLNRCKHKICHKCLLDYVKNNINCKIKCPIEKCGKNIPDQIIRKCLSNTLIDFYEQKSILSSTKKAVKCLTEGCPFVIVVEDEKTIFQCYYCNQPNCVKCKKRHYPNQCGRNNNNETDIDKAAIESMKIHRRAEIENLFKDEKSVPNPDSFECSLCDEFVLPREGFIFRNCHHTSCKLCFDSYMKSIDQIDNFNCPTCETPLNDKEVMTSIGETDLLNIAMKKVRNKLFACKFADCSGMWDPNNCKGLFACPVCKHVNCLDCKDIHEEMSCDAFRLTKRFRNSQMAEEKFKNYDKVECICGKCLIQKGGCGALYCDNCGNQVCVFTGKKAGNYGPDSCGCTSNKPCHPKCIYGCFPDTPKEKAKH